MPSNSSAPKASAADLLAKVSETSPEWYLVHARMMDIDNPIIWRQLIVPSKLTIDKLELLLESAFGWAQCHMHTFTVKKVTNCATAGQPAAIVTDRNPAGFLAPKYKLNEASVHEITADTEGMDPRMSPVDMMWSRGGMFGPGAQVDPAFTQFFEAMGIAPQAAQRTTMETKTTFGELVKSYKMLEHKHALVYEYDHGDCWEHLVMVEKVVPADEVKSWGVGQDWILGGSGHGAAEDCGSIPGWKTLKAAYEAKDTPRDTPAKAKKRDWYESVCSNGDDEGLKGQERLRHFDVQAANQEFAYMLRNPLAEQMRGLW